YRVRDLLPHQIVHTICEIEPAKPSLTVERMEETTNPQGDVTTFNPVTISELRSEPLDRLRRRLAGDLDNIVLMAIRKEQRHRYSSVELFARDIRQHLDNLPVVASKHTLVYRAHRYVRRNRLRVITVILALACMVGGGLASRWQAEREKQRIR